MVKFPTAAEHVVNTCGWRTLTQQTTHCKNHIRHTHTHSQVRLRNVLESRDIPFVSVWNESFVGEESSCGADTRSVRTTGQQRTFHHRRRDFLGKARLSGRVQSDEHTECVCECVRRSRWHHTVTQREAFSCQCFLTAHKFASFTAASHTRSRGVNGGVLQILGHNTWCPQKLWLHLFVVKPSNGSHSGP